MAEALKDFEGKFERGEIAGWAKEQQGAMAHTGAHLDLSAFDSAEELASLGLDRYVAYSTRTVPSSTRTVPPSTRTVPPSTRTVPSSTRTVAYSTHTVLYTPNQGDFWWQTLV
jgi:hypothetical protein